MLKDRYGNELGTQSAAARDAYVRGVDSLMAATAGTDQAFAEAVAADDGFALGHISLARAKQLMGRGHEAKAGCPYCCTHVHRLLLLQPEFLSFLSRTPTLTLAY